MNKRNNKILKNHVYRELWENTKFLLEDFFTWKIANRLNN